MLEAIVFDLGGTLFQAEDAREKAAHAQHERMKELGYDLSREKYREISKKASKIFHEKYYRDPKRFEYGKFMEIFFDLWGKEADEEDLKEMDKAFIETSTENQKLMPHGKEAIEYCRGKGLTLGVISNGNELMTERRLKKIGMEDPFDVVLYSTGVGAEKSAVEPFKVFLRKTGLEGEECLMVGNRMDEDTYAKKVGMKIVLLTKNASDPIGEKMEPDYRIQGLDELRDIIESLT